MTVETLVSVTDAAIADRFGRIHDFVVTAIPRGDHAMTAVRVDWLDADGTVMAQPVMVSDLEVSESPDGGLSLAEVRAQMVAGRIWRGMNG